MAPSGGWNDRFRKCRKPDASRGGSAAYASSVLGSTSLPHVSSAFILDVVRGKPDFRLCVVRSQSVNDRRQGRIYRSEVWIRDHCEPKSESATTRPEGGGYILESV